MKQINNGFCSCYYMTEEGYIYNAAEDNYIYADERNNFKLQLQGTNKTKKISLKSLYRLVYRKAYCIDNIKNIEGEIWKEIENTEGNYFISSLGRVKSYTRYKAIILKPTVNVNGYERLEIQQERHRANKLIHRLVAAAFLPMPDNIDMQLHHKDFNKHNNAAVNLEWLSPQQHREKHREQQASSKDFTHTALANNN